jgi:mono/diheme cytochrome c family protein
MDNRKIITEGLLGALFILLSAGLLLYEGFKEPKSLEETAAEQQALAIEAGAETYIAACAECHGLDGRGGIGAPLNDPHMFDLGPEGRLAELGWGGTLEDFIVATVSGGRAVSTRPELYPGKGQGFAMPAWAIEFGGPMRPDQIRDVAAFILNWQTEANGEVYVQRDYLVPPSDDPVFSGRLVYNQFGCGACHTIDGISVGVVGPNLTNIATDAATRIDGYTAEDYIRESILNPTVFIAPECPTGPCAEPSVMPQTFGEQMTEEQINNLLIFLLAQE